MVRFAPSGVVISRTATPVNFLIKLLIISAVLHGLWFVDGVFEKGVVVKFKAGLCDSLSFEC